MTNTLYSTKAISYQVNDSLLAGNNSIWANWSLTKNLVSQSAKNYANQAILATNGGWDKGKHSKRGEFTPFAKGDLSHLSKEADYPHWQDLRVTNSYAQKKKDSVQAVLIQLHSVELVTNNNSLRVLVTNLPSLRGEVSRLPNSIGLPDYIGLVQYFLSSVGGWDLMSVRNTYGVHRHNLVNNVHSVQPLGLMPLDCSSLRAKSLNQLPKLIPSSLANSDNCSLNSDGMRIWNVGDSPSPFGDLSLLIVDMYVRILLVWVSLRTYINMTNVKIATPRSAANTIEAFNHNVNRGNTMAMYKSTQTHPKFKWRFFSCQQSKYFSVEACNEKEARSLLPDSPCLFSARIRQEGGHA